MSQRFFLHMLAAVRGKTLSVYPRDIDSEANLQVMTHGTNPWLLCLTCDFNFSLFTGLG